MTDSTELVFAPPGRAPAARPPRAAVAPCLAYEDTVVLRGRLSREVYPGPPNYESLEEGDAPEPGFYLTLDRPICARAAYPNSDDASLMAKDEVKHIQLVLNEAGYTRLQSKLGRVVEVRGLLFAGFTGHHHAPLLLRVIVDLRTSGQRRDRAV